jgi:DNA-binding LacI/PurR family transcriptional regulator
MAHIAVHELVQRLKHERERSTMSLSVTPRLTIRDTTAPPPDDARG